MSYLVEEEIACRHCNHPNLVEVWSIVNVKEDPELKDMLTGGEINMSECQACHEIFYAEHFLIYHDPAEELLVFVYPFEDRLDKERWEQKTKDDFKQMQPVAASGDGIPYEPISLFGLDDLVQMVQVEEERAIQAAIVSTLAAHHNFPVTKLTPLQARTLTMPQILPLAPTESASNTKALVAGLEHLMTINSHLFVYADLLKRLNV